MICFSRFSVALAAVTLVASAASASPQGFGPQGFKIAAPSVTTDAAGARIHGAVCRTSAISTVSSGELRIERIDGGGRVMASAYARLSRGLTGRDGGCGFYDRQTDWRLAAGEHVAVCAASSRSCRAG